MQMVFIETPTFTKSVTTMLREEEYRLLQNELAQNPEAGDLIPGGGGIRKIRIAVSGKGKRGGGRIIYYWQKSKDRIFMLLAFSKARQTDLDPAETATLKFFVKELERHG
jgi:hypothetical protein